MHRMRTDQPAAIRLADYRPPAFKVESLHLSFDLKPSATRVRARLALRRDGGADEALRLDGVRLKLISIALDGEPLPQTAYVMSADALVLSNVPDSFVLETEVEIDPLGNTALEGLYMSGGRFCTQCEAEGFRKITFFPDRPDVLTRYTVRIEADLSYPRLLSNGNLLESGALEGGRHYAVWTDPFPKPAYLFALVAGELDVLEDQFTTVSGRTVDLRIYVDPGQAGRAAYAMDSLKRAMAWDEATFGREYDLDLFMIVAVRDFNFGAMENKGLNIFNSALLLADSATATDVDYERIESVVAHEYFHNWTGNRITCRDWFQLCLKEGLTVFRDQSFSADQRGAAVQRIKDVRMLRARQFSEDAGPLAHPVRPDSYVKIDNFYTATIYEKGAEIIRMLKLLLGETMFRKGMDRYFATWDGTATTVEAFVECFAEASGCDLSGFMAWYNQAGTPKLTATSSYDAEAQTLTLNLTQSTAPTPGQSEKHALTIPVRLGLLDVDARPLSFQHGDTGPVSDDGLIVFDQPEAVIKLTKVQSEPTLSLLRGFSAPVNLAHQEPAKAAFLRLAADPDLFNRWEASQGLARALILARAAGSPDEVGEERFAEALGRALGDQEADEAFKALLLDLPSEPDLAMAVAPVDPARLHVARTALRARIAVHLEGLLTDLHGALQTAGAFSVDAVSAGRRALRNAVLDILAANPTGLIRQRAEGHFEAAANMTDAMGGLNALMQLGGDAFERALARFYETWRKEPLVIDKWFAIQARAPGPDAIGRVLGLTAHPAFDPKTPNRFRALVSTFATANPTGFHDETGAGYAFVADQILAVDGYNPGLAARLVSSYGDFRRYRPDLAELMQAQLTRIVTSHGLSSNVLELAAKALDGATHQA
jgi:aminopeptidase N